MEGGGGKYLLSTELHTYCKTLLTSKLFLQMLKIDFFLGLNSSFESFMQKNHSMILTELFMLFNRVGQIYYGLGNLL